jgi:hypothetical protein
MEQRPPQLILPGQYPMSHQGQPTLFIVEVWLKNFPGKKMGVPQVLGPEGKEDWNSERDLLRNQPAGDIL